MGSGLLVLDKPAGMTSHDVVQRVRKALGTRRVGHAGTLDPMATGVLVVAVDEATKLVPYLTAADKEYEATVTLGVTTDTLDADGRETARADIPEEWHAAVPAALAAESARTEQSPPSVSAIHTPTGRAHERVRRGEEVVLAPREVVVGSLEVLALGERTLSLRVRVSKGYYVRALARDLAAQLGTVGHLTALRRVRSGPFELSECLTLEATTTEALVPLAEAARRVLPEATLTEAGLAHARAGRRLGPEDLVPFVEGVQAWLSAAGELVAIATVSGEDGRVLRGFAP